MNGIEACRYKFQGGLPYIATSGTTVYLARQAGLAAAGRSPHVVEN